MVVVGISIINAATIMDHSENLSEPITENFVMVAPSIHEKYYKDSRGHCNGSLCMEKMI